MEKIEEQCKEANFSVEQFIQSAVVEKLSFSNSIEYLEYRGSFGSREKYEGVLAKVKNRTGRV